VGGLDTGLGGAGLRDRRKDRGHEARELLRARAVVTENVGVCKTLGPLPEEFETSPFSDTNRSKIVDPDLRNDCGDPELVEGERCHLTHRCSRVAVPPLPGRGPPANQGCLTTLINAREADFTHTSAIRAHHSVDRKQTLFAYCATVDPALRCTDTAIVRWP